MHRLVAVLSVLAATACSHGTGTGTPAPASGIAADWKFTGRSRVT
jgi:hypothetical protein